MNDEQLRNAEQLHQTWPTVELVQATTAQRQGYKDRALDLTERELDRRGVSAAEQASIESQRIKSQIERLTGVRGSLLLLVVMLGLASLLASAGWTHLNLEGSENTLRGEFYLVLSCCGFFVLVLLLQVLDRWHDNTEHFIEALLDRWSTIVLWLTLLGWLKSSPRIAYTHGQLQDDSPSDESPRFAT